MWKRKLSSILYRVSTSPRWILEVSSNCFGMGHNSPGCGCIAYSWARKFMAFEFSCFPGSFFLGLNQCDLNIWIRREEGLTSIGDINFKRGQGDFFLLIKFKILEKITLKSCLNNGEFMWQGS